MSERAKVERMREVAREERLGVRERVRRGRESLGVKVHKQQLEYLPACLPASSISVIADSPAASPPAAVGRIRRFVHFSLALLAHEPDPDAPYSGSEARVGSYDRDKETAD